ncbi:hypothetical protein ROT00_15090 [Agromyces mediolanus]|uniref:hypothetical protein n=1 Tax=Agromyces mediolanus TaxID=41986 RepID=UPI003839322A
MTEERAPEEGAHEELDDATVIVERTAERAAGYGIDPADADTADRPEEATVVVDRSGRGVRRGTADAGEAATAEGDSVDGAAANGPGVDGPALDGAAADRPGAAASGDAVLHAPSRSRRRRREPKPAPVSDEVLRTAEPGPGVGVLDRYPARTGEPLRMPIPDLGEGPGPTRDPAAALPSVAKRSRRTAVGAIIAVVVAGALGLAGLVAVGSILWRTLFG